MCRSVRFSCPRFINCSMSVVEASPFSSYAALRASTSEGRMDARSLSMKPPHRPKERCTCTGLLAYHYISLSNGVIQASGPAFFLPSCAALRTYIPREKERLMPKGALLPSSSTWTIYQNRSKKRRIHLKPVFVQELVLVDIFFHFKRRSNDHYISRHDFWT